MHLLALLKLCIFGPRGEPISFANTPKLAREENISPGMVLYDADQNPRFLFAEGRIVRLTKGAGGDEDMELSSSVPQSKE